MKRTQPQQNVIFVKKYSGELVIATVVIFIVALCIQCMIYTGAY
jgi:hypothetical protein